MRSRRGGAALVFARCRPLWSDGAREDAGGRGDGDLWRLWRRMSSVVRKETGSQVKKGSPLTTRYPYSSLVKDDGA